MARKDKKQQKFIYEKDLDNYYDLNYDAVDRLVNADEETAPEVGKEEIKKYKSGFLSRIPMWVKALFIKFWFNGAVCFFFIWGLSTILDPTGWDMLIVAGLAMGVVTDLLVNNVFRFMAEEPGSNDKWMMVPQKKFWTFFVNIIYAFVVFGVVVGIYTGINMLILRNNPGQEYNFFNFLGVEPFLYGLFYLLVDMAFIGIKNLFVKIVRDAKAKTQKELDEQAAAAAPVQEEQAVEQPQQITVVHQVTTSGKKSKKKRK